MAGSGLKAMPLPVFKKTYMHQKYYLLLLLWAAACTSQRHANRAKQPTQDDAASLNCLKVTELFPLSVRQGKRDVFLKHDTGYFYLYTFKDMVLCKSVYQMRNINRAGDIVSLTDGQNYFVYKKGNTTGNLYDSLMRIFNKRKNVDSAMELVWKRQSGYPDFVDEFVESRFDEATQSLIEKYTYYQVSDTASKGARTYYFSKIPYPKNLYSLWPAMDSAKKMRFYKCFETHEQQYYKKQDIMADAFYLSQTGEIVPPADTAMVMHFFRQEEAWQKNNGGR
jgi:REP element-mobilizing transposase RayT